MKGITRAALVIIAILLTVSMAMAAGNRYIPGSRDMEGTVGENGRSFEFGFINTICGEGVTSNAYESCITFTDPTADRAIVFPDAGGTVAYTDSTLTGTFSGTVTGTITGTLVNATILDANDANILVANALGGKMISVPMSGDATIANTGALTIGNNKIGLAELNVSTKTVNVWPGQATNTATVTSGSAILGMYPFANVDNMSNEIANSVSISGTTLTLVLNDIAADDVVVYRVVVLEP